MGRSSGPVRSSGGKNTTYDTQTKPEGRGVGVVKRLGEGNDKAYLCTHICLAKGFAKVSINGHLLKQRACTETIWKDEELHLNMWRFKAEVGYLMDREPPTPLMSNKMGSGLRPSRFPLGAAIREIEDGVSIKGNLRIPDCIILKISDREVAELAKKFATGGGSQGDLKHFIPVQDNIDTVVEIKFEGDRLTKEQKEAYERIAGPNQFRELKERDCHCNVYRKDPRTQPYETYIAAIKSRADFNSLFLTPNYVNVKNPYNQNMPLAQFINKPTIATIAFGVTVVTVAIIASIGGTPATGLAVLGVGLGYASSH